MTDTYTPTERTRLVRRPQRGRYDAATVHAILDAGLIAHVGYLHNGQPVVTPTAYWREGEWLYWHAAAQGRALPTQAGQPVCFTVSLVDALTLGRSGIAHSMHYRSVMAFGVPELVRDADAKRRAMDRFIDSMYPGRTAELRPAREAELAAIAVLRMRLGEVSAKVKEGGINEMEGDLAAPAWAGFVPLRLVVGEPVPDPRLRPGTPVSPAIARYVPGQMVEAALRGRGDL